MGSKRNLSVGITVNLDNYENLRLEVSGEVEGEEEAEELIRFLDGILGRFGRGSEETTAKIESFRRRVIQTPGSAVTATAPPKAVAPPRAEAEAEPAVSKETPSPEPPITASEPAMIAGETVIPSKHITLPGSETGKATVKEGAGESGGAPAEFKCERCGVPITPVQRKLSRLFQDRDLCRNCLNRP